MTPTTPEAPPQWFTDWVASQQPSATRHERIEPIMFMLLFGLLAFAVMAVTMSKWSPNDGQTFQFLCSIASGFSGAFLGRVVVPNRATNTTSTVAVPPVPPAEPKP